MYDVFKSKRFVTTLVMLLLMITSAFVPKLSGVENALTENIVYIIMTIFAGYGFTDVARMWLGREGSVDIAVSAVQAGMDTFEKVTLHEIPDSFEEIIKTAVRDALNEAKANTPPQEVNIGIG